jgi:hypothetical protein
MNRELITQLLPAATQWATDQAGFIASQGRLLTHSECVAAKSVGVQNPQMVRVLVLDQIPAPQDQLLSQASMDLGLLGPDTAGLTLGYGIFIKRNFESMSLLSHELRHVSQYEAEGSIALFLKAYLMQIAEYGYLDAPYEIDARAHELS